MSTLTCADLAERLTDLLRVLRYDTTPVLDSSETDVVDQYWQIDPVGAEGHVAGRLSRARYRLLEIVPVGDVALDARIALGAHVRLQQLQGGTQ